MTSTLWWLLQNLLVVSVLIPFVCIVCRLLRNRPAVQHALWLVVLMKFVTPPVVTWPWSLNDLGEHIAQLAKDYDTESASSAIDASDETDGSAPASLRGELIPRVRLHVSFGLSRVQAAPLTSAFSDFSIVLLQLLHIGGFMATAQIQIATGSGTPIYRQIVDQVRLAAATGAWPPGHSLPSVRSLAERLLINVNTVAKAYGELVREGVVESRQSLGYFIAPKRQIYSKAERVRRLRQVADVFVREAISLDFTADEILGVVEKCLTSLDWIEKPTETTP